MRTYTRRNLNPGNACIFPYGSFIYYPEDNCPICKERIANNEPRYTEWELPHGYYEQIKIPYGAYYKKIVPEVGDFWIERVFISEDEIRNPDNIVFRYPKDLRKRKNK